MPDKERDEIFTPTRSCYFIGARWKCSPEDNSHNTELERTTHCFTFSSLRSCAPNFIFFLGMLCSADWKGRQRFNSTVKNIGKSHHCNCLKRVISQFLSTSTLVHCPVVYPTMYMHQAPADSRKSMSAVNSTDCSFSCLLAASVSYVFDSEWASYALLCVVELRVGKVGWEQDWLQMGFLIWHRCNLNHRVWAMIPGCSWGLKPL